MKSKWAVTLNILILITMVVVIITVGSIIFDYLSKDHPNSYIASNSKSISKTLKVLGAFKAE